MSTDWNKIVTQVFGITEPDEAQSLNDLVRRSLCDGHKYPSQIAVALSRGYDEVLECIGRLAMENQVELFSDGYGLVVRRCAACVMDNTMIPIGEGLYQCGNCGEIS